MSTTSVRSACSPSRRRARSRTLGSSRRSAHTSPSLELDLLKTEFVTRVSHELRTPPRPSSRPRRPPSDLSGWPSIRRSSASSSARLVNSPRWWRSCSPPPSSTRTASRRSRRRSISPGSRARSRWITRAGGRMTVEARRAGRGPRRRGLDAPRAGQPHRQRDEVRASPITVRVERGVAQAVLSVIDRGTACRRMNATGLRAVPPGIESIASRASASGSRSSEASSPPSAGGCGSRMLRGGAAFRVTLPLLGVQFEPAAV